MSKDISKSLRVNLDEDQSKKFESIKKNLGLTQDSEVVRHLIKKYFDEIEINAEATP